MTLLIFLTAVLGAMWLLIHVPGNMTWHIIISPSKLTYGSMVTHSLFSCFIRSHFSPLPQNSMPLWHCLIPHNQWTGASCHGWKWQKYLYFQSMHQVLFVLDSWICLSKWAPLLDDLNSASQYLLCMQTLFLLNDCLAFFLLEKNNHFQNVTKMICLVFP